MTEISAAARSDLAPACKLRVGINFSNNLLTASSEVPGSRLSILNFYRRDESG